MTGYQVHVRIELRNSDTGVVITYDNDDFYTDGDREAGHRLFDAVCDGAGKAAAEFSRLPTPCNAAEGDKK